MCRKENSDGASVSTGNDTQTNSYCGVRFVKNSFEVQSRLEIDGNTVYSSQGNWRCVALIDKKQFQSCPDCSVSAIEHNKTVELGEEKGKWEGDVYDGKPCGWGIQYDQNGNMVYEGFRVRDTNACYGTRYYPENHQIAYVGNWHMGKRWGRGVQYDRAGKVVYEGDWMNNRPMKKRVEVSYDEESKLTYPLNTEELIIVEYAFCDRHMKKLDLSIFSKLRVLEIDEGCFSNVVSTHIEGFDRLEAVRIYSSCFEVNDDWGEGRGKFFLCDCPALKEFVVGEKSFANCTVCEMRNLPSLETISIGSVEEEEADCFWYSSLVLRSRGRGRE